MTTSIEPASPPTAAETGLRANVLGLFDSIVMAVAGSAPAYTIAGSTAALLGAVAFAGRPRCCTAGSPCSASPGRSAT